MPGDTKSGLIGTGASFASLPGHPDVKVNEETGPSPAN